MTVKAATNFELSVIVIYCWMEHEIDDLPMAVKTSLIEQRFGVAVRLDVEKRNTTRINRLFA